MINWKLNLRVLAAIELVIGALMLIPTALSWYFGETEATRGFLTAYVAIILFSASAFLFIPKPETRSMHARDGYLIVSLTWVMAACFSSIPFTASGAIIDFPSAFFELMSGFTTTGFSVLPDIETLPRSLLFWRSMTNWLGGMGIVVLFVALLPALGVSGSLLVSAETAGPSKDKLTPRIKTTALILWSIYLGLSLLQTILLLLGGLDLYDAVTITFSTISAAGFTVKDNSIGSYNSLYIENVVTVFMLLSGINFTLYFKALTGRLSSALKDGELRIYLGIWAVVTLLCALQLTITGTYQSFFRSLRYSGFQAASVLTTTGFSSSYILRWPPFSQTLLLLLCFVGGCAGSAAGGIKVVRVAALFKMGRLQMKRRSHPRGVFQVRIGQATLSDDVMIAIGGFIGMYLLTGLIGGVALSLGGLNPYTSMVSSFQLLGNIGFLAPLAEGNYAFLSPWLKWFCSFLMLVGRLELFTIYALFSKYFWKR